MTGQHHQRDADTQSDDDLPAHLVARPQAVVIATDEGPGIRPEDVFVIILDAAKENWSVGHGLAQFA